MAKKESVNLNVRVPSTLKDLINRYIQYECNNNASEFTRDALSVRAKDGFELYEQLLSRSVLKIWATVLAPKTFSRTPQHGVSSGFSLFSDLFAVLRFFSENPIVHIINSMWGV